MSVYCIPTPHISSKTGVNGGKSISLIFYPKHRLWVFVTTKRRSYFPKDGLTLSNSKSDGIPDGGLSRVNHSLKAFLFFVEISSSSGHLKKQKLIPKRWPS